MGSKVYDEFLAHFTSYRSITDCWDLYSIADSQNAKAVRNLFNSHFDEIKKDYKLLTELTMILNHKLWYWYELNQKSPMVSTYEQLYNKANNYALTHLNHDEIRYFKDVTD